MGVRTNLALDPELLVAGGSLNASLYSTPTRDTTTVPPGTTNSLSVTRTATSPSQAIGSVYLCGISNTDPLRVLVTPGQTISVAVYVRTDHANGGRAQVSINWKASDGSNSATMTSSAVGGNFAAGTWSVIKYENVVVPAGTAYILPTVTIFTTDSTNAITGAKAWFGAVMIESAATAGTYFDGSTPSAGGYAYAWTGAANSSTSTETLVATSTLVAVTSIDSGTTNAVSINVPISASAAVGDLLVLVGYGVNTGLTFDAPPAGWTQVDNTSYNASTQVLGVWYKTAKATDIGGTVTLSTGTTSRAKIGACYVVRGGKFDAYNTPLGTATAATSIPTNNYTPVASNCRALHIDLARVGAVSTDSTQTAPAGFTEQLEDHALLNATNYGILALNDALLTGGAGVAQTVGAATWSAAVAGVTSVVTIANTSSGSFGDTLQGSLNRLAGTTNLDAQGAANVWAGTTGMDLVGALNYRAGTFGVGLQGVLNLLAGTTGLGVDEAASRIQG